MKKSDEMMWEMLGAFRYFLLDPEATRQKPKYKLDRMKAIMIAFDEQREQERMEADK